MEDTGNLEPYTHCTLYSIINNNGGGDPPVEETSRAVGRFELYLHGWLSFCACQSMSCHN